jgi:hypothetical protein
VFTLIDSLYYVPNPREILGAVRKKLLPGGLLIARVTNRNLYARVPNLFARDGDFSILGDAMVSYSCRGLSRLLNSTGFRITKLLPDSGQGKQSMGFKRWVLYRFSHGVYAMSGGFVNTSPGLIVLARPASW